MRPELLEILQCPACYHWLELDAIDESVSTAAPLQIEAKLFCRQCSHSFPVVNSVPIFAVNAEDGSEKFDEITQENHWTTNANSVAQHVSYARRSAQIGEAAIRKIKRRLKGGNRGKRVLDIGAGWGAFQAWQFARHGFDVVATELVPEFLLAARPVIEDAFFDRVATDCTVLPFQDESFDVALAKEVAHHLQQPDDLFREMWRVVKPGGLIVIQEKCISAYTDVDRKRSNDRATRAGLSHFFYTYQEYRQMMRSVCVDIRADGDIVPLDHMAQPLVATLINPLLGIYNRLAFSNRVTGDLALNLRGGIVRLIGVRKPTCDHDTAAERKIAPIGTSWLSSYAEQAEFYHQELVPPVFDVFRQAMSAER